MPPLAHLGIGKGVRAPSLTDAEADMGSSKFFGITLLHGPDCERQGERLGGVCESAVSKRTTYLVIGTFRNRDWVHILRA